MVSGTVVQTERSSKLSQRAYGRIRGNKAKSKYVLDTKGRYEAFEKFSG